MRETWTHVFPIGVVTIAPGEFRLDNRSYHRVFPLTREHEDRYRTWFASEVARVCRHTPRCHFALEE